MPFFSYVGKLDSPDFFWDDIPDAKFRVGNTPHRLIPTDFGDMWFTPDALKYWANTSGFEEKQIDWSAWGIVVRKSDLEMIWKSKTDYMPWDKDEWQRIWLEIEGLEDDQKYVLVSAESVF